MINRLFPMVLVLSACSETDYDRISDIYLRISHNETVAAARETVELLQPAVEDIAEASDQRMLFGIESRQFGSDVFLGDYNACNQTFDDFDDGDMLYYTNENNKKSCLYVEYRDPKGDIYDEGILLDPGEGFGPECIPHEGCHAVFTLSLTEHDKHIHYLLNNGGTNYEIVLRVIQTRDLPYLSIYMLKIPMDFYSGAYASAEESCLVSLDVYLDKVQGGFLTMEEAEDKFLDEHVNRDCDERNREIFGYGFLDYVSLFGHTEESLLEIIAKSQLCEAKQDVCWNVYNDYWPN